MKIELEEKTERFVPIIIRLETLEEAVILWELLNVKYDTSLEDYLKTREMTKEQKTTLYDLAYDFWDGLDDMIKKFKRVI